MNLFRSFFGSQAASLPAVPSNKTLPIHLSFSLEKCINVPDDMVSTYRKVAQLDDDEHIYAWTAKGNAFIPRDTATAHPNNLSRSFRGSKTQESLNKSYSYSKSQKTTSNEQVGLKRKLAPFEKLGEVNKGPLTQQDWTTILVKADRQQIEEESILGRESDPIHSRDSVGSGDTKAKSLASNESVTNMSNAANDSYLRIGIVQRIIDPNAKNGEDYQLRLYKDFVTYSKLKGKDATFHVIPLEHCSLEVDTSSPKRSVFCLVDSSAPHTESFMFKCASREDLAGWALAVSDAAKNRASEIYMADWEQRRQKGMAERARKLMDRYSTLSMGSPNNPENQQLAMLSASTRHISIDLQEIERPPFQGSFYRGSSSTTMDQDPGAVNNRKSSYMPPPSSTSLQLSYGGLASSGQLKKFLCSDQVGRRAIRRLLNQKINNANNAQSDKKQSMESTASPISTGNENKQINQSTQARIPISHNESSFLKLQELETFILANHPIEQLYLFALNCIEAYQLLCRNMRQNGLTESIQKDKQTVEAYVSRLKSIWMDNQPKSSNSSQSVDSIDIPQHKSNDLSTQFSLPLQIEQLMSILDDKCRQYLSTTHKAILKEEFKKTVLRDYQRKCRMIDRI